MKEKLDKNGLTEEEFLNRYDSSKYAKPSLTADNLIFVEKPELSLLLIKRGGHPFLDKWALPGGFVEEGESADEAAARELEEETGITGLSAQPMGFYSEPGRDPRGWVVTRSYVALLSEIPACCAGDDAREAGFFKLALGKKGNDYFVRLTKGNITISAEATVERLQGPVGEYMHFLSIQGNGLAFDHAKIIMESLLKLEKEGRVSFDTL